MKRIIFIILSIIWIQTITFSQSCLPNGITFGNQQSIDNFSTNFPDCIEIEGDVVIYGSNITNLNGLSHLTKIGGKLNIGRTMGSSMVLTDLSGLDSLISIGGNLSISYNDELVSLTGLDQLSYIGGALSINSNENLNSLASLNNVNFINGELIIKFCPSVTSLEGLDHIPPESITSLTIRNNTSLSSCEAECICAYLSAPNGTVNIKNNAEGCNNPHEIAEACGTSLTCLPYGHYYLSTQAQIDHFQENYPHCSIINGNLSIMGKDISNLSGLSKITEIKGNLNIGYIEICTNPLLRSLEGLHHIKTVGGMVWIEANEALLNLTGLRNMVSIGNSLSINGNNKLSNLKGLSQMKHYGGGINISGNPMLTSLSGLENVSIVPYALYINNNDLLEDLSDLKNIKIINGHLGIYYNNSLTDISSLENIIPNLLERLSIMDNPQLSDCHIKSICGFLADTLADAYIINNMEGCTSTDEVITACEDSFSSCLPEGITLNSQSDIEDFQNMYPNCSWLEGDIHISGSDITDLSFLNTLVSIGGNLKIYDNVALESFNGLENLVSVGGDLYIGSNNRNGHPLLTDLSGLSDLIFVDGDLVIENNQALTNLSGLEHIQPEFLNDLSIRNNPLLSDCSIENICYYLSNATGVITISDNETGCNNQTEITIKCVSGLSEQVSSKMFYIYPNPAKNELFISVKNDIEFVEINIYNQIGQIVLHQTKLTEKLDISALGQGMYIVEIISEKWKNRQKFIIGL